MSEEYYDSSVNEYIIKEETESYKRQTYWDMAIGLQKVDNLKPSKYLENLTEENIIGKKTIKEVEQELRNYYIEKNKKQSINMDEFECDLVSTRIVEFLQNDYFELSVNCIKDIHKFLFKDIYDFAGTLRDRNFSKHEIILNGDSVPYTDYKVIEDSLEYDLRLEKDKDYKNMNIVDIISSITDFTSRIWQVHPFREGNTRTTAVFIEKYLRSLGYEVDNTLFKDKSVYFRNALVRSNYSNSDLNIKTDSKYLVKFYENLLLGKTNNLHSEDLIVKELVNK